MRKWHATVCSIFIWMMPTPTVNLRTQKMGLIPPKFEPTPKTVTQNVGVPKVIPNSISEFFGQSKENAETTTVSVKTVYDVQFLRNSTSVRTLSMPHVDDPDPPDLPHRSAPVQHAGLPRKLEVFPLPLEQSDHELKFNVSWVPSTGGVANGYSLEVWSLTETVDCQPPNSSPTDLPICYEYNIAGNVTWALIPAISSTVAETCAIRPGCAYNVKLKSHPWDGHTTANLLVELDECVVGVCSCAHWPRLPTPVVSAQSVIIKGKMNSNISWTLPTPSYPQRLPSAKLGKKSYIVSLSKQMVTDAILFPWFANVMNAKVDADGFVSEGDTVHSILFPISQQTELKVKLIARVQLVDERGCVGPAGNATVFDPEEVSKSKFSFGVYAILGALIGAWAMGAVFVLSARVVKRVLKSFRPAPVSAPLEQLRHRPAWFPLQLRSVVSYVNSL